MKKIPPNILISLIFAIAFALIGALISINRFYQFDTFYYDFGIFDQAIWKVANFRAPIIDHHNVGGHWIFGDHFNPALFLLSPLYWLTDKQEIIFIAQAIMASLSGFVLFLTARKVTSSTVLATVVQLCFYLFAGLQNAIITDFHEVTIATLPISLMFYALVSDNKKLYLWSTIWFMLHKESSFLIATGIHFYAFMIQKQWRTFVSILGLSCIAYAYLVMQVVIPAFSGRFQYNVLTGHTLESGISALYNPPIKIQTLRDSLASFTYTPLLTPLLWPTYFFHYAARFLSEAGTRWDIGMHYNAEIAPIYAFSMILVLQKISRFKYRYQLLLGSLMLLTALYMNYFKLKRPFFMGLNPALYAASSRTVEIREFISQLPDEPSIMAQNTLAAQISHKNLILMRDDYHIYDPDYIFFDTNPDQNGNNWFGLKDKDKFILNVTSDPNYYLKSQISSYQLYAKIGL